jgi:hypothetical protein
MAASACGRKTIPLVPDSPRPEAISATEAVARGAVVYLSWPLPTRNVEGKGIAPSDIRKIRIYRAELGRDRKMTRYKRYAEIDMKSPAPAILRNNVVTWTDDQVRYGQTYGYRIRAESTRGGVSPWSEEIRVMPQIALSAPKGLAAKAGDSNNRLTWQPVNTWMDGKPVEGFVGYNIYRGIEKGFHGETPLNKEPLQAASYKDASAVNNTTYYYVVRAVDSPAPPWLEGPDSEEVSAMPRDLTPPARPTGLTVVAGVQRMFLTWNENQEADLAGYYVYRSIKSGKDYVRLTEKLLNRTTFSDEHVKSGAVYYYVVTAVDLSGNESSRSEEKKASVEKLR